MTFQLLFRWKRVITDNVRYIQYAMGVANAIHHFVFSIFRICCLLSQRLCFIRFGKKGWIAYTFFLFNFQFVLAGIKVKYVVLTSQLLFHNHNTKTQKL